MHNSTDNLNLMFTSNLRMLQSRIQQNIHPIQPSHIQMSIAYNQNKNKEKKYVKEIQRQSIIEEYRNMREQHREWLATINMTEELKKQLLGFTKDEYLKNPYQDIQLVTLYDPFFGKLNIKSSTNQEIMRDKQFKRKQKQTKDPNQQNMNANIQKLNSTFFDEDSRVGLKIQQIFQLKKDNKEKNFELNNHPKSKYKRNKQTSNLQKRQSEQMLLGKEKQKESEGLPQLLGKFLQDKTAKKQKNNGNQVDLMKRKNVQKNKQQLSSIGNADQNHFIEESIFDVQNDYMQW